MSITCFIQVFAYIKADDAVKNLIKIGAEANTAKECFKDFYEEYLGLKKEIYKPKEKSQLFQEDISSKINRLLINDIPYNIQQAQKYLSGDKLNLAINFELDNAQKSLKSFIKSMSEKYNVSENIISEEVFSRLKELAAQGNITAQSLINGWKDATKEFDEFSQKAKDYVEYLNVAPEKFTPAFEKMAKGIQKIDPLTGKVTEQFKKAYSALKEWANVTFDKVAQRIQRLRKAVEGGFIDKKALEEEYRKISSQVKAQIIMELEPEKKNYSQSQYRSILASEYQSRMSEMGGESFTEMMKKEFGQISGEAMGAIIERTADRTARAFTNSYGNTQKVLVNGKEIQQGSSQGFNMQNFTQALSPVSK